MQRLSQSSPAREANISRYKFILFALATIALGLIVHELGASLNPALRDKSGDMLWAAMIAWCVGAIAPETSLAKRVLAASAICFSIEASQLYHSPLLDAARTTTTGQLTLGSGFDPIDLVAYLAGILVAAAIELFIRTTTTTTTTTTTSGTK